MRDASTNPAAARDQPHTGRQSREHDGIGPPVRGSLDDAEYQRRRTGHGGEDPEPVQRRCMRVDRFGQQHHTGNQGGDTDRDVDQKHRAPPEMLQQPATDDRPQRQPDTQCTDPHRDRAATLVGAEQGRQDPQRQRHDDRGPDAHERAGGDQRAGGPAESGPGRGGDEGDQTYQQQPFATVAVTEAAGGQHERGEDQGVGVDDPLQLGGARAEVLGQGGQGDVENHQVQPDGEQGDDQRRQPCPPT